MDGYGYFVAGFNVIAFALTEAFLTHPETSGDLIVGAFGWCLGIAFVVLVSSAFRKDER